MKIPKLQLGDPVVVVWRDAGGSGGWSHMNEVDLVPITVPQIGWWVRATDEAVYLAQAIPPAGDGAVLGPSVIPLGCVESIRKVKV